MTGILVLVSGVCLVSGFLIGARRLERYLHRRYPGLRIVETRQSQLLSGASLVESNTACDRDPAAGEEPSPASVGDGPPRQHGA